MIKILAAGLQFGMNVVLARYLGDEGVGRYFLCLSVINVLAVWGIFGTDKAMLRFVSSYVAIGRNEAVRQVFKYGHLIAFVGGIIAAVTVFLTADIIADKILERPDFGGSLRLFSIGVIPTVFLFTLMESFKGLKRIITSLSIKGVFLPLAIIMTVIVTNGSLGLDGVIWAYNITAWAVVIVGFFLWKRYTTDTALERSDLTPEQLQHQNADFEKDKFLNSARPLFTLSIFQQIILWSSVFMLGIWKTDDEVGIFGIAQRLAALTSLFLIGFNTILAPKVSRFFARNEMDTLKNVCQKSTLMITVMASPIFIVFALFPEFILSFFGEEFAQGGNLLRILLIGQLVSIVLGPVGLILIMGGKESKMRNTFIISALVILLGNFFLIAPYGATGAAIATASAAVVQNIIAAIFVYREFKLITLPTFLLGR